MTDSEKAAAWNLAVREAYARGEIKVVIDAEVFETNPAEAGVLTGTLRVPFQLLDMVGLPTDPKPEQKE